MSFCKKVGYPKGANLKLQIRVNDKISAFLLLFVILIHETYAEIGHKIA